uniref:uncharacterized protein LOC109952021 n=1 Tax=Monopterus albus TaxID=43700 RepID=UPI0009B33BA0|nr:uncharacterized protein LOC109952021 [Monopterus albus]
MDPAPACPPEIRLSDREEPYHSQSGPQPFSHFSLHHHQPFSPQTNTWSDSRAEQCCPHELHHVRINDSALERAYTAEMLLRKIVSDHCWAQRESHPNQQYLHPGPIQTEIQAQESPYGLNFQPVFCHPSLHLLSPDARGWQKMKPPLPKHVLTPCSSQDCRWLDMSPCSSKPTSRFDLCPHVATPSSPYLPSHSSLQLPDLCRCWCMCAHTTPVHQPCGPSLLSRNADAEMKARRKLNLMPESTAAGKPNSKKAKSEGNKQNNTTHNKNELRENATSDHATNLAGPLPCLDEELPTKCASEKYIVITDSLKIQDPSGEKANPEREHGSFLEYQDELCSDEDFVRKVEQTLNTDYPTSLLSSDPKPLDLLELEKQEHKEMPEEKRHQPSASSTTDPVTHASTSLVRSTLNTELLKSLLSTESIPVKAKQEELEVILQEQLHPPSADYNCKAVMEATSLVTSCVKQRAQSSILNPAGTWSDPNLNHNGPSAAQSTGNMGPTEGGPSCSPLLPSHYLEETLQNDASPGHYNPANAWSNLCDYGSLLSSPDTRLTSDLEANDYDVFAAIFTASDSPDLSEDASVYFSNSAEIQSTQSFQNIKRETQPGDPPASESPSTSGVSGPDEDGELLIDNLSHAASSPAQSGWACKRLLHTPPSTSAQITETEEQSSSKTSYLEDMSHPLEEDHKFKNPATANSSFVAHSQTESCDPHSSGPVPDKRVLESSGGLQVANELAYPVIASECRREGRGDTARKSEKNLDDVITASQRSTAMKAREEGIIENESKLKEGRNTVKLRCSQRLLEKGKATQSGKLLVGRVEERKQSEKRVNTATFYEQKRRSLGERQLRKRGASHFQEWSQGVKINTVKQFSEMGKKEQKHRGQKQQLKTGPEKQHKASNSKFCTKLDAEDALLIKMPQKMRKTAEQRLGSKKRWHKVPEVPHHSSRPKPSPDQTAHVRGEDKRTNREEAESTSYTPSPVKRCRQEHEASEETETAESVRDKVGMETNTQVKSSQKSRVEVTSESRKRKSITVKTRCNQT